MKNKTPKVAVFIPSEHDTQCVCVRWYRAQYPFPKYLIAAIPNGARTSIRTAVKLKDEGLLAGFPDLIIPHARLGFFGLYIEMKKLKQKSKPHQIIIQDILRREGYKVEKDVDTFEKFEKIINDYLK
jgi:hypothetical protein